jgi:tRNA (uracil-5-)-methyltransferase
MLSYDTQLQLKQDVVRNAYRHFSGLASDSIPDILPTIPSPKEYGYRTKITPHFDARPKRSKTQNTPWELRIGFDEKGRRSVLDIEVFLFQRGMPVNPISH